MSALEQYIAFMTILRKEIRRFIRIWPQTLLPSAITMSLYFVIFGSLIGSRIGQMGGFSYMEFVVPGLIMMAIVNRTARNLSPQQWPLVVRIAHWRKRVPLFRRYRHTLNASTVNPPSMLKAKVTLTSATPSTP